MLIALITLLIGAALIIWAIRDGIKNPAQVKNRSEEYYKRVDKIFNIIIVSVVVLFVIGATCARIYVKYDLNRMVKELTLNK